MKTSVPRTKWGPYSFRENADHEFEVLEHGGAHPLTVAICFDEHTAKTICLAMDRAPVESSACCDHTCMRVSNR